MRVPVVGDVVEGVTHTAEQVTSSITRSAALIPRLESIVARVEHLLDAADKTLSRANDSIDHIDAAAAQADAAVARASSTLDLTDAALARTEGVFDSTTALSTRADELLSAYAGPLAEFAPTAKRLAESVSEHEVDALVGLVDRLPDLLERLERDVLPMMNQLRDVGPDVHALLETVEDLRNIIGGLPGASLFRRRGEVDEDAAP